MLYRIVTAQFLQVVSEAQKQPTPVLEQALKLLVVKQPDWISIKQLDRTVFCLYQAGLALSTQEAYSEGKKWYLNFCEHLGVPPLPVSDDRLCPS